MDIQKGNITAIGFQKLKNIMTGLELADLGSRMRLLDCADQKSQSQRLVINSNNMQNYSLLVAVYNEKGMMMGSEIFSGSVRALSVDSPTIECTLPDGYKKIICYLMDGYVDARLLAEPFVLK